jgi:hypothetical protein
VDEGLVYGLAGTATPGSFAADLRDLTLTWSRYGYRGRIVEGNTPDDVLADALALGYGWCLVQAYGDLVLERWSADADARRLEDCLEACLATDVLVLGELVDCGVDGWGLEPGGFLVNLQRWDALGRPAFGAPSGEVVELVEPAAVEAAAPCGCPGVSARALLPTDGRVRRASSLHGWGLVDASLRAGLPVLDLEPVLADRRLALARLEAGEQVTFMRSLRGPVRDDALATTAGAFLRDVRRHLEEATRSVFLWNIEPYDDVESPPAGFVGPLTTLYAVASGFKPNAILESHGFADDTRIVLFDYSASALAVRRFLVEEWDGADFPACARSLFERFQPPETAFHLPDGATPATLDRDVLEDAWARELDRWGGAEAFQRHWARYRELPHEYVLCDIVSKPVPLLDRVRAEDDAVIWWSNAFFTVSANWLHAIPERRRRYERWIDGLAERNPGLFLVGSDFCNSSVNDVRAGEYRRLLAEHAGDGLVPLEANTCAIRF